MSIVEAFIKTNKEAQEKEYHEEQERQRQKKEDKRAKKNTINTALYTFIAALLGTGIPILLQFALTKQPTYLPKQDVIQTKTIHDTIYIERKK
jgi:hypothetical protein